MTKSNVKLPKTLNVTVTDAMIEKDIIAVKSKVKTVNNAIQSVLTKVMLRWHQSNDVGTACRFMNTLVLELDGSAVRNNAIKAWIEAHCGFQWLKGDDGKSLFTYNKKQTKISYDDVVKAHQNTWSTFTKEAEYKGVDTLKIANQTKSIIEKALQGAEKDSEKHKVDNIDMDFYKLINEYLMTK